MSSLTSLNRSMLRLTGMSSGMDTTSMVTSMLQLDQYKVDKQFKAKTKLEWKGDAYRDFNLKIRNFRETYMSVLSPETNIFSSTAFNAFKTNMADESMSKYVSISAGSNAQQGSLAIKSIDQLASAAKAQSTGIWGYDGDGKAISISLDTKLSDAFGNNIEWATEPNPEIAEKIDAGWTAATSQQLTAAGITAEAGYTYMVDPNDADNIVAVESENRYVEFSVNGESFRFEDDTLLSSMISTVNAKSASTGVTMSYSSLTKGFTFTARDTGADSKIELANVSGKVFGENATDLGAFGIQEKEYTGNNALVTFYDDQLGEIEVSQNSNNFSIDGITYNLKQVYNGIDGNINFTVERDIEPVFEKIKGFIDGYNALIDELQTAYNQRPNRTYDPLTEDEKSQLTEKEAEKWEGMAKEGLLYRDSYISSLLSTMRSAFYDSVDGVGRSAADIGLQTTAYDYTSGGKITIDEDKLRSALMSNPEQVKDIFTKVSTNEDGSYNYKESGLVTRISTAMNNYVSNVTDIALSSNTRQLNSATSKLEQLEEWLLEREDYYWTKFSAMETALASLNSQSSWLSGMLGTS